MATTTLEPRLGSLMTTDSARAGFEARRKSPRSEAALSELTNDLSAAVNDAYWKYMLQGELEDAFDTALLRAAMADTPVLTAHLPIWST